jgi:hypothetical protein
MRTTLYGRSSGPLRAAGNGAVEPADGGAAGVWPSALPDRATRLAALRPAPRPPPSTARRPTPSGCSGPPFRWFIALPCPALFFPLTACPVCASLCADASTGGRSAQVLDRTMFLAANQRVGELVDQRGDRDSTEIDAFLGLIHNCANIGVGFWDYLGRRWRAVPRLPRKTAPSPTLSMRPVSPARRCSGGCRPPMSALASSRSSPPPWRG